MDYSGSGLGRVVGSCKRSHSILKIKSRDSLISQIYFWNRTLHISDSSSVHHQEFFTVHIAMVYVLTYNYCCVYSEKTPDDRQRNCQKHVEFYSKNKFEKLVHLVGFIVRVHHDAQSPERQIHKGTFR